MPELTVARRRREFWQILAFSIQGNEHMASFGLFPPGPAPNPPGPNDRPMMPLSKPKLKIKYKEVIKKCWLKILDVKCILTSVEIVLDGAAESGVVTGRGEAKGHEFDLTVQVDKLEIGDTAADFGEHERESRLVRVWRLFQIDQGHWCGTTVYDLKWLQHDPSKKGLLPYFWQMMRQWSFGTFLWVPLQKHNCLNRNSVWGRGFHDRHCEDGDRQNNVYHGEELEYCRLFRCVSWL